MAEVGFIASLTRLLFKSIRIGASWVTEVFVRYCEGLVRMALYVILAIGMIGLPLIYLGLRFNLRLLTVLGVFVSGISFVVFAISAVPANMVLDVAAEHLAFARKEIDRVSNIIFVFILTMFYVSLTASTNHPELMWWFLAIMVILYFATLLPGDSKMISSFRSHFQWIILVPVGLLITATVVPASVWNRMTSGHGFEKATGTIATEIDYQVDDQDRLVYTATGKPIAVFQAIADDNGKPVPNIGWERNPAWERDQKNRKFLLFNWFDKQKNVDPMTGGDIYPMTAEQLELVIAQGHTEQNAKAAAAAELKKQQDEAAAKAAEEQKKQEAAAKAEKKAEATRVVNANPNPENAPTAAGSVPQPVRASNPNPYVPPPVQANGAMPVNYVTLDLATRQEFSTDNIREGQKIGANILDNMVQIDRNTFTPGTAMVDLEVNSFSPAHDSEPAFVELRAVTIRTNWNLQSPLTPYPTIRIVAPKKPTKGDFFKKTILGGLIGAAGGAIVDGKKGAVIGAAAGAGAGATVALVTRGNNLVVPANYRLPPIQVASR